MPHDLLKEDFLEWLRGFVDGEGTFVVSRGTDSDFYTFIFQIWLHEDDLEVLHFIKETLGFGEVILNKSRNAAYFRVMTQADIQSIIDIFSRRPLNTTKHFNFLAFKKAFELYTCAKRKSDVKEEIEIIISRMNAIRSTREGWDHKISVTPNWLLGFVEGEGSFVVAKRQYTLIFSITQSTREEVLMEEIKILLNNLPSINPSLSISDSNGYNVVNFSLSKKPGQAFDVKKLSIQSNDYIKYCLIPFFDALTWRTKKNRGYNYWKIVLELKELGRHYEEEGVKVLDKILSTMNRLSSSKKEAIDLDLLTKDINSLLSRPSNLEIREPGGRIFIKSLNRYKPGVSKNRRIKVKLQDELGIILKKFDTIKSCAEYLGVDPSWAKTLLVKGKPVKIKNKNYFIKEL